MPFRRQQCNDDDPAPYSRGQCGGPRREDAGFLAGCCGTPVEGRRKRRGHEPGASALVSAAVPAIGACGSRSSRRSGCSATLTPADCRPPKNPQITHPPSVIKQCWCSGRAMHVRGFMLYEAYQVHNDILGPIRLVAEAFRGFLNHPWPLVGNAPCIRRAAAAMELLSNAGMSHDRPDFGIRAITIEGKAIGVAEEVVASDPFCNLLHFRKDVAATGPTILVVAPLSGHFPTLLRGTVKALLPDHDVFITDWANARDVPLLHGRFGLDDFVDLVIRFIHVLGPRIHVMAVCQPSVPVLAAVSLLAAADDPHQPASMILMGGPIDPAANPTAVNRFAEAHSLEWFERTVITTVPGRYPGAFRRVYPGFLQLAGFLSMNLERHVSAHWGMFENLVRGHGDSAAATRAFYKEYSSVMDLPADFYLHTIKRVFP